MSHEERKVKPEEQKASPMFLTEAQRTELKQWVVMRDEATRAYRLACAHIRRIEAIGYIASVEAKDKEVKPCG